MGLTDVIQKHNFEGIGKGGATLFFLALASNPGTLWMTQGLAGKILFWFLTRLFGFGASNGLVQLNIGIARIEVLGERETFDGSFDEAFRLINESGGNLTDEQKQAIDQKVIDAFKKFADMSRN